jgi:hypothetical protein
MSCFAASLIANGAPLFGEVLADVLDAFYQHSSQFFVHGTNSSLCRPFQRFKRTWFSNTESSIFVCSTIATVHCPRPRAAKVLHAG